MNKRPVTWHTNKEIVVVRATDKLANWAREKDFEVVAAKATATPGYFLVDAPGTKAFSPRERFIPKEIRREFMLGWFSRVFESELSEMGLPVDAWPDTSSIEIFEAFFVVEHHPLIADFGAEPLKTAMVQI